MNRSLVVATLASLGVMLSACGGGDSSSAPPPPPSPSPPPPPPADTTAPTVPTGVTAAAQSPSSILVSWTASTDATGISGYRVFRDGNATAVRSSNAKVMADQAFADEDGLAHVADAALAAHAAHTVADGVARWVNSCVTP